MKFITEMELRDLYQRQPFHTFVLAADERLTPGGRQFLIDRRVMIETGGDQDGRAVSGTILVNASQPWALLRLRRRLEYLESLFWLVAIDLERCLEAGLAEEVTGMGRQLQTLQQAERDNVPVPPLVFWDLTEAQLSEQAGTAASAAATGEKRAAVLLLRHLRAALGEIEPALLEAYWDDGAGVCKRQDLIERMNAMRNALSLLIGKCLGGQPWKQ